MDFEERLVKLRARQAEIGIDVVALVPGPNLLSLAFVPAKGNLLC